MMQQMTQTGFIIQRCPPPHPTKPTTNPNFLLTLLQIPMHRLPIQAEADHLHSGADNSYHLGPGHIHYVSLGGDVTSD